MSIYSKHRFTETVGKELEAKLPQASPKIRIRCSKLWFVQFWRWMTRYKNGYGYITPRPPFFFTTRGANFKTLYLGPISISYKMPWLLQSARSLYPNLVKEHNDNISKT